MKVAIGVGGAGSGQRRDWERQVEYVREAERLGVDQVWTAEAWGMDAVAPLAYIAAKTDTIKLGTGIMQISARAPVMTAMTAMTMAAMTDDRFILGLGVSGPQVVEGLHGTSFDRPLSRLREYVDIVKLATSGERVEYDGTHYQLPRPAGKGKALRLAQPPTNVLIYLATLGPNSLRYTGAVADGWVGTSFVPEGADATIGHIRDGALAHGRNMNEIDLAAGGAVEFGDDVESLIATRRPGIAFSLGAMGSATENFYNDAYRRAGFEDAGTKVQALWLSGDRAAAAEAVPDELVLRTNLIGTAAMVADRIRAYRDAGITTLRVQPEGGDLDAKLETLAKVIDLVSELNDEPT